MPLSPVVTLDAVHDAHDAWRRAQSAANAAYTEGYPTKGPQRAADELHDDYCWLKRQYDVQQAPIGATVRILRTTVFPGKVGVIESRDTDGVISVRVPAWGLVRCNADDVEMEAAS
jgi:hypothetical protein